MTDTHSDIPHTNQGTHKADTIDARDRCVITNPKHILAGLIVIWVLEHLALYRSGFISLTADEFGRTVVAAEWAQSPHWIWSGNWLPFHFYLLGSLLRLHWDLLLVPRLSALVFGALSIWLVYTLTYLISKQHLTALGAAVLLTLNPAHLWLSSGPLSEVPYTVCWLGALCSLVAFHQTQHARTLIAGSLLLGVATGIRYEGWFVAVVWSTYVVGYIVHARLTTPSSRGLGWECILAASLPWLFPLCWMLTNAFLFGNPLAFANDINSYKQRWYGNHHDFFAYITILWKLDPIFLIVAPIGIFLLFLKKLRAEILSYIALSLIPLAMFIGLHRGQIEPFGNYVRYLAPFIFVLYPAVAYAIQVFIHIFSSRIYQLSVLVIAISLFTILQLYTGFHYTNDPAAVGLALGQRLRVLREATGDNAQPVMIELSYWQYLAVQTGANDITNVLFDRRFDPDNRTSVSYAIQNPDALQACIASRNVTYVAIRSPNIQKIFKDDFHFKSRETINGYEIYPVTDTWRLQHKPLDGYCMLK